MRNEKELKKRIKEEKDFIYNPKMGNSLTNMVNRYPDGLEDKKIAKVLLMPVEEVVAIYDKVIVKLRKVLKVGE